MSNPQNLQDVVLEQNKVIENLESENSKLKEKIKYLEDKMKQFINEQIQKRLADKKENEKK